MFTITTEKEVAAPPGYHYNCPLCGSPMHFIGPWHCYNCGTDWQLEELLEVMEIDEY